MSYSKDGSYEVKCLQFELWQDCNNGCPWCYLKDHRILTNTSQRINNIDKVIEDISGKISDFNAIGLIGGEFFQGQLEDLQVKNKFLELIKVINTKLLNKEIYEFWLTASLISSNQQDLYDSLDLISFSKLDEKQRILLCTSYDTLGRFHAIEDEDNWFNNVQYIKEHYPNISLHTQIILTQDLIDKMLEEPDLLDKVQELSMVDFKIPNYFRDKELAINGIKDFHQLLLDNKDKFPKKFFIEDRESFLEFLPIYLEKFGVNKLRNLINYPTMRSHTLKIFSEDYELSNRWEYSDERKLPCGHLLDGKSYLNSDECMYCDIENFIEMYEE